MSMNGKYIGDRYVKLLHVPRQEMVEQVAFGTTVIPSARTRALVPPVTGGIMPGPALPSLTPGFIAPAIDPRLSQYQQIVQPPMVPPGYDPLSATGNIVSSRDTALLSWLCGGYVPSPISQITKSMQSLHLTQPPVRPNVQTDGSTVKIRGLPFRASRQEILEFFTGYDILPDTLHIGVDRMGRPSGEGWVTFTSANEARRAVRDKNRQYLGNRYLELSIC